MQRQKDLMGQRKNATQQNYTKTVYVIEKISKPLYADRDNQEYPYGETYKLKTGGGELLPGWYQKNRLMKTDSPSAIPAAAQAIQASNEPVDDVKHNQEDDVQPAPAQPVLRRSARVANKRSQV
jgi:hypothetical protein